MDEFDMFLARAYGGGEISSATQPPHQENLPVTHDRLGIHPSTRSGRRHSSVAVRCSPDANSDTSLSVVGSTTKTSYRKQASVSNEAMMGAASWSKPSATVIVAVEPPSPTELRPQSLRSQQCRKQASMNSHDDGRSTNYVDNEDTNSENNRDSKKMTRAGQVSRNGESSPDNSDVTTRPRHSSYDSDVIIGCPTSGHTTPTGLSSQNVLMTSAVSTSTSSGRPDRLRLGSPNYDGSVPTVTVGSASPGQSRRQSTITTFTDQRLLATTNHSTSSAETHRRYSYTETAPSSPSNALRAPIPVSGHSMSCLAVAGSSGRRNSAITYLSESADLLAAPGRRRSGGGGLDQRRSFSADGAIVNPTQLQHLRQLAARGQGSNDEDLAGSEIDTMGRSVSSAVTSSQSVIERHICRVAVLGAHGVGKKTLTNQLLTSEYLANIEDEQEDENNQERSTSILLDNEETLVQFIDDQTAEEAFRDNDDSIDAFLLVYSVTDRTSFTYAQSCLQEAAKGRPRRNNTESVVVLVANKQDLVRNRVVSTTDGKRLASKRRCKFLEVSALLDHKVDEVLVTIVRQSRSRIRRRFPLGFKSTTAGTSAINFLEDLTPEEFAGKGCIQRAAFTFFRKIFK